MDLNIISLLIYKMNVEAAIRHYQSMQRATKKYYEANKEEIIKKKREKYAEEHPPSKRGRPRKIPPASLEEV